MMTSQQDQGPNNSPLALFIRDHTMSRDLPIFFNSVRRFASAAARRRRRLNPGSTDICDNNFYLLR
ncbi:hypothetical protein MTR67_007672 [Solanum verrucosum]|uniref:Uncharacterized protein n=1 Tax=Solanum verrucosum TaxID=315347 RepID=A0AAF0TB48_SOLVR|nr:hypothetical protein MTR67_007672 [Solanum verrucosum]